jgi:hypothetical protein
LPVSRDLAPTRNATKRGPFAKFQEISGSARIPVSTPKFPSNREINRESRRIRPLCEIFKSDCEQIQTLAARFPTQQKNQNHCRMRFSVHTAVRWRVGDGEKGSQLQAGNRDLNRSATNIPSAPKIASIMPNGAMPLSHSANLRRMTFSERTMCPRR